MPRMTNRYFKASIYLLPSLNWALCAIDRCRAAVAGAAAGRINSTVARRSSQYTATAAAPVITVAKSNMATFTRIAFLPCVRKGHGTVHATETLLKIKEL